MKEKTKNILRWVILIPACLLTILFCLIVFAGLFFILEPGDMGPKAGGLMLLSVVFCGWVFSAIPIWFVSRWIVPVRKKMVAWISVAVLCGYPLFILVFGSLTFVINYLIKL